MSTSSVSDRQEDYVTSVADAPRTARTDSTQSQSLGEEAQRAKDAQLVRDMLEMPQWKDQAWARMALTVAARAIERGRHWTPDERLDNLFDALMEEAMEGQGE